jgi:ankyrin repeat protein
MKEKVSILDELDNHFNHKDGGESKFSFSSLGPIAQTKLTAEGKLTKEAMEEANAHSFDHQSYKILLVYLKNSQPHLMGNLIKNAYNAGKFDLEKLFKDNAINKLAAAYSAHKGEMDIERLLLLNPGKVTEDNIKRTATFAHALLANKGPTAEDIVDFFKGLDKLSRLNPELISNYLALSDEYGKSISVALEEKSLLESHLGILDVVKRECSSLYPSQDPSQANRNIDVDTHTGSVHGSVDKSFATLALIYNPSSIRAIDNERVVSVDRSDDWSKKIQSDIDSLGQKLTELMASDEVIAEFIAPTLARGENKDQACKKFKFQAQTALRMIEGLQQRRYGNHYTVESNEQISCGLTPKEIVAIGYASLANRDLWNNKEQETQQFIQFVENLYIAKRGYNIDKHGNDEWQMHSSEPDDNKCTGGTINQVAYGLTDHTLVEVKIITANTMLPILSKTLPNILRDVAQDADDKFLMENWLNGNILNPRLADKIIEKLKNDSNFKEEFSAAEIQNIGKQVLNKLDKTALTKIKEQLPEIFANQVDSSTLSDIVQVNSFAFDPNKGYVPYLEHLYNVGQDRFTATFRQKLSRDLYSDDAKKMNLILSLLLKSQDKDMANTASEIFTNHVENFTKEEKDQYFILMAEANYTGLFDPLIKAGADVNARDNRAGHAGITALDYAARNNNVQAITALLAGGVNVNATNKNGHTALHFAARDDNAQAITALLKGGVEKEAKDINGWTALHWAARDNNAQAIKALLEGGVDKEATNKNGHTALHLAARNDNSQAITALLAGGVDKEAKDKDGWTALHLAAKNNNSQPIKDLLAAGVEKEAKDINGWTALHLAASYGRVEAITALLKGGVDGNAKNNYGDTALHWAARNNNSQAITDLLKGGVDGNAKNNDGDTALHWAAMRVSKVEAITALLAGGVNVNATNKNGHTALDIAIDRNSDKSIKALLSKDPEKIIVDMVKGSAGWVYDDEKTWEKIAKIVKALPEDQRVLVVIKALEEIDNTSRRARLVSFLPEDEQNSARSKIRPTMAEAIRETFNLVHGNSSAEIPKRNVDKKGRERGGV